MAARRCGEYGAAGCRLRESDPALLSGEASVILMNGVITEQRTAWADRIAQKTGARVVMDTFVGRVQRGAGRAEVQRLPYFGEQAAEVLAGTQHLILLSTQAPITFFAYPDKPIGSRQKVVSCIHWLSATKT